MPKYLNTTGVSYHLEELIKQAKDKIYLVSPYLKLNDRIFDLIEDALKLKLDVRLVYGKNDLQPEQSEKLKQLRSMRVLFAKTLHAKCYLSENMAIVTSMNLYEFSQVTNFEMGILVERSTDGDLYQAIYDDVQHLMRRSEEVQVSVTKVVPKPENPRRASASATSAPRPAREKAPTGFCIRCSCDVPLNPSKPYCGTDYERWADYGNEEYVDKVCHGCGKKHPATMLKPLCRECWKALAA